MTVIIFRIIFVYLFLVFMMRLSGKRQIGELQLSELVTAFLLSELAAVPVIDTDAPLLYGIIPVTVLICLEIINSFLVTQIPILKNLFVGKPSIIINKGKLDTKELSKLRLSIDELIAELHLKDISDISDVEYAILEQNGKLSVFPKSTERPPAASDLSLTPSERGIAHPLVFDGKICADSLNVTNKTEEWIIKRLKSRGYSVENTFLFTLDDLDREYIIPNNKKIQKDRPK